MCAPQQAEHYEFILRGLTTRLEDGMIAEMINYHNRQSRAV
ncbi:Uncharacterised protein [Raoultella terrigena]|jgi:hypothetical protein|nr:Uncharacterised protein [Raoultella terrigena]